MSEQQKPPNLPEHLQNLQPDPRITEEMQELLQGDVNLHGNTVHVTGYVGSEDVYHRTKHYVAYRDQEKHVGYATIERFMWVWLPRERKEQLKKAGLDPDQLYKETHPILKAPDQETAETTEMPTDLQALAAAAGRLGAREAVAELTGRRRRTKSAETMISVSEPTLEERREHLTELIKRASIGGESMRGKEPETEVALTWHEYRQNILPKINKIDGARKPTATHDRVYVRGWVLARKPTVIDKRVLTQEALLGTDGRIHVYMRDDLPKAQKFLGVNSSRKDIQDSSYQSVVSPFGRAPIATSKDEVYFHTVSDGNDYPFLGVKDHPGEEGRSAITPELIQRGLEELIVERGE